MSGTSEFQWEEFSVFWVTLHTQVMHFHGQIECTGYKNLRGKSHKKIKYNSCNFQKDSQFLCAWGFLSVIHSDGTCFLGLLQGMSVNACRALRAEPGTWWGPCKFSPPSLLLSLVLSATVAEQDGLEANSMGSGDWVYSLLTSCESLARYAPPLCLSLFICNMGLIIVSTLLWRWKGFT